MTAFKVGDIVSTVRLSGGEPVQGVVLTAHVGGGYTLAVPDEHDPSDLTAVFRAGDELERVVW